MPPIPDRVVTTDGKVVIAGGDIANGQGVWQAMGGMEVGSIWGHGSYVAPDWTADWLHRECEFMLNDWSTLQFGQPYDSAHPEQQGALRERLKQLVRLNTFDARTSTLTIDAARAKAFEETRNTTRTSSATAESGTRFPRERRPIR